MVNVELDVVALGLVVAGAVAVVVRLEITVRFLREAVRRLEDAVRHLDRSTATIASRMNGLSGRLERLEKDGR